MHRFKRIRALFGLAIAWAAVWIPAGMAVITIDQIVRGRRVSLDTLVSAIPALAVAGAISGFAFGLVLAAAERRRGFANLSLPRFVIWGIGGTLIAPLTVIALKPHWATLGNVTPGVVLFCALGATSAAATLALARRAPAELASGDKPLLER